VIVTLGDDTKVGLEHDAYVFARILGDELTELPMARKLARIRAASAVSTKSSWSRSGAANSLSVAHPTTMRSLPSSLLVQAILERRPVEEHPRIDRAAVEPRGRRTLWILGLVESFPSQHPPLIAGILDTRDEGRTGQSYLGTQTQQVLGRESPCALRGLRCKKRPTQFIKATGLGSKGKSIVGSHRLGTQEAAHAIFDCQFARLQSGRDQRSVGLFELSAVGALRILEEDHALARIGIA